MESSELHVLWNCYYQFYSRTHTFYFTASCWADVTHIPTPSRSPTKYVPTPVPKRTPYESPFTTPYESPFTTPYESPITTPIVTPYTTPLITPISTPYITPLTTQFIISYIPTEATQPISISSEEVSTSDPIESSFTSYFEEETTKESNENANESYVSHSDSKSNTTLFIIIGVCIAVLLILILIIILVVSRRKKDPDSSSYSSEIEMDAHLNVPDNTGPSNLLSTINVFTTEVFEDSDPFSPDYEEAIRLWD